MQGLGRLKSRPQSSLFLALALQFLTPNFSASFVTPSIHLRFGLPARLLPSGLSKVIFLRGRLSCIRITFPAHLSLHILIVVTRSTSSYIFIVSSSPYCLVTFFENLSTKFKFGWNQAKITSILHEDLCTFLILSRSVPLRMWNVSD